MKDYFLRDGGKLKKFGQKNRANAAYIKYPVPKLNMSILENLSELIIKSYYLLIYRQFDCFNYGQILENKNLKIP